MIRSAPTELVDSWKGLFSKSVETELVSLDVLHHEARLIEVIGRKQSDAYRAKQRESCAFGLQGGQAFFTHEPGAHTHIKMEPIFTALPSGTRWKNSRGPTPEGSTHANHEP